LIFTIIEIEKKEFSIFSFRSLGNTFGSLEFSYKQKIARLLLASYQKNKIGLISVSLSSTLKGKKMLKTPQ